MTLLKKACGLSLTVFLSTVGERSWYFASAIAENPRPVGPNTLVQSRRLQSLQSKIPTYEQELLRGWKSDTGSFGGQSLLQRASSYSSRNGFKTCNPEDLFITVL